MSPRELQDNLLKLSGLTEIETRIYRFQSLLQELPQNLKEMEEKLVALSQSFSEKKKQLDTLEFEARRLESDLIDAREKIKERESKTYELKTTKEFQAAGKEISTLKKQSIDNETRLMQLMGQIESLKTEVLPLELETQAIQEKVTVEKNRIGSEIAALQKDLESQIDLKQNLLTTLDSELVDRYEQVLLRRRPAIASAVAGVCQECNMHIPPQLFIEMQKFLEITGCPSCNRILYIPASA